VTKLFGSAFPAINQVSVPPQAKKIHVDSASGSLVQISTTTPLISRAISSFCGGPAIHSKAAAFRVWSSSSIHPT
jgi:hypothetical protein